MTEAIIIDKEQQKSEMKYSRERMLRAKKHNVTAEALVADAGAFCNAALFAPLPVAELAIVNEALDGVGNPEAIIVRAPGIYVKRRGFQMLRPGLELLDGVIDFYMHCISLRQNKLVSGKKTRRQF